jgi:hypothetical protein
MAKSAPGLNFQVDIPYVYRILGPFIAGIIPLDEPVSFYLLSIVFSITLILLFHCFLIKVGISSKSALFACVLFVFNKYFFGFNVWDYFQINDILSFVAIVLLFWSMNRSNWLLFGSTALIASLAKATWVIIIPTLVVFLLEKKRFRGEIFKAIAASVPALAVFIAMRTLIPARNGQTIIEALMYYWDKILDPQVLFKLLINSFIPLTFLPIVFIDKTIGFFRGKLYALTFVLLVFGSCLLGTDNERLIAPTFIVFYWLIGYILDFGFEGNKIIIAIVMFFGFLSSLHHCYTNFSFMTRNLTLVFSLGSLAVVTISAIAYRLLSKDKLRLNRGEE